MSACLFTIPISMIVDIVVFQESPWHEILEGYNFVQDCDDVLHKGSSAPDDKSLCEVCVRKFLYVAFYL